MTSVFTDNDDLNNSSFFGMGRWKPTWKKVHKRRGGKKPGTMNQHTLGKEFCGEGKKNGGTAGGKLGE